MRALEYLRGQYPVYSFHIHVANSSTAHLANSRYNDVDVLRTLMKVFECEMKPTFNDSSVRSFLQFGLRTDNDPLVGIKRGKLYLSRLVHFYSMICIQVLYRVARRFPRSLNHPPTE